MNSCRVFSIFPYSVDAFVEVLVYSVDGFKTLVPYEVELNPKR